MRDPIALTMLACAAATIAAATGHYLRPAARAARHARRLHALRKRSRALELEVARARVAGSLAVNPSGWTKFWYEHELDDLARGGA